MPVPCVGATSLEIRAGTNRAPIPSMKLAAAPATTLLVLTEGAPSLVREACRHARANHERELYCLYVSFSGRFRRHEERRALEAAVHAALEEGIRVLPMTHLPGNAADVVIRAAEESGARVILMNGVERRSLLARFLGRRTLRRIRRRLSPERSVLAYD
jgi:hypothetical protein